MLQQFNIFFTVFCINKKKSIIFYKLFDFQILMHVNVLGCPDLDLTNFGKCLSICERATKLWSCRSCLHAIDRKLPTQLHPNKLLPIRFWRFNNLIFFTVFCINKKKSIIFYKIFDFQILMQVNVLGCPELDLTIFGKCLLICESVT